MTNKLEETQKENRKFIIDNNFVIKGELLTLNRVLISFKSMELGYLNGFLFQIDTNIDSRYEDEKKIICEWDLTKETLEEQSEETQKGINKLLTKIK